MACDTSLVLGSLNCLGSLIKDWVQAAKFSNPNATAAGRLCMKTIRQFAVIAPTIPIAIMNNNNHVLQPESKAALRMFLGNDSWLNATNEQVDALQDMIVLM